MAAAEQTTSNPNGMTAELLQGVLRLMAGDNSISFKIDPHADTACINMHEMTVYLPELDESADYDATVGFSIHEALHCKYTNPEYAAIVQATLFRARRAGFHPRACAIVPDAINILEDVRIESKGMEEFPGLRRAFRKCYNSIWQDEIWPGIQEADPQDIWNRVNFAWKMSQWVPAARANFNPTGFPEVQGLIDQAAAAGSTEEIGQLVLDNLEDIQETEQETVSPGESDEPTSGCQSDEEEIIPIEGGEQNDGTAAEEESSEQETTEEDAGKQEEPVSKTHGSPMDEFLTEEERQELNEWREESLPDFDESLNQEIASDEEKERYPSAPEIVPMSGEWKTTWLKRNIMNPFAGEVDKSGVFMINRPNQISTKGLDWQAEFMKKIREKSGKGGKRVTDAVKTAQKIHRALERKKKAAEDAMTRTWDSGDLDVTKMHLASVTDDIFLTHQTEHTGKGYGLIFMLDASGSMIGKNGKQCAEKLAVLTAFCKMSGIKFRVVPWGSITRHGGFICDDQSFRTPHLFARFFMTFVSRLDHRLFCSGTDQSSLVTSVCGHLACWEQDTGIPIENTRIFLMTDGAINDDFNINRVNNPENPWNSERMFSGFKKPDGFFQTRSGEWIKAPVHPSFGHHPMHSSRLGGIMRSAAMIRAQFPGVSISGIFEDAEGAYHEDQIKHAWNNKEGLIKNVECKVWHSDEIKGYKVPMMCEWKFKPGAAVDQIISSSNMFKDHVDSIKEQGVKTIPVKGSNPQIGSMMGEYAESLSSFIAERKLGKK